MPHLDPKKIDNLNETELRTKEEHVFLEDLYPKYCMGYGDVLLIEEKYAEEAKLSIRDTALKYLDTENELIGYGTMDSPEKEMDSFCISHRKIEGTTEKDSNIWISFTYFPDMYDDIIINRPNEEDIVFKAYRPIIHERLECSECGEPLEYHLMDELGIDTDNLIYYDEMKQETKKKKSRKKKNKDEN